MSSNRAWMPLHIEDYLKDTGHLNALEHGAYLLLIMHYWRHGELPADERIIARIAKLSPDQWEESRPLLAMMFQDGWRHKRIDAELARADEIIEKRRKAADARHKRSKQSAHALHVESTCSDTGALPITNNLDSPSLRSGESSAHAERKRAPDPIIVLAGVVGNLDAKRFVDHLAETGKRPSSQTAEAMSSILLAYKAKGGNPVEAVNYAIRRGWKSLDLEWLLRDVPPADASAPKPTPLAQWTTDQWRKTLEYCRERGEWEKVLGPPPWADGCLCPRDLWQDRDRQRFGVEVAA